MTRWARGHKKKHVNASSWEELQQSMPSRRTAIKGLFAFVNADPDLAFSFLFTVLSQFFNVLSFL